MEGNEIFYIIIGVIFVLVIISIAVLSSIVLLTIICNWRAKCRSTSNLLIINSCVTFLFFAFTLSIQTPFLFHANPSLADDPYTVFCRIRAFLLLLACLAKVLSYLTQAISRFFINVLHKHRSLLTYRTNGIMIFVNWLVSLIIAAATLISPVAFQYESESRFCLLTTKVFHTSITLMIIAFLIPVVIIIILYGIILRNSTRLNRIQPNNSIMRNNKRDLKVFRNILLLLVIIITCGTPFLLSIIINKIADTPWPLYSIAILFIALSSAAEVLAIFLTHRDIKTILYGNRVGRRRRIQTTATAVLAATVLTNSIKTITKWKNVRRKYLQKSIIDGISLSK